MGYIQSLLQKRASPENPTTNLANPAAWLWSALGAERSVAGVTVSPRTALEQSTVFACVRVISQSIASLPFPAYRRVGKQKERAPELPQYKLLHTRPNPEIPTFTFWETLNAHIETWGNAFAEIERNGRGVPIALWPIGPDRMSVRRENGKKVYVVTVDGRPMGLAPDQILHIPGLGFDGLVGYSVIYMLRRSIGLSIATEEFGANLFASGARPGGVITRPAEKKALSDEARLKFRHEWEAAHAGLSNTHRVAILEEGMKWEQMGIPPDDAQFLQTRQHQRTEIAGWFGVPPHMIGDMSRSSYASHEQEALRFVIHTIRPRCTRIESVVNYDLFAERERDTFFAEYVLEALLRGDSAARAAFYKEMFAIGAYSPNDIRAKENEGPVDGGDTRFVPMNMVPLAQAEKLAEAQITKASTPAPEPEPPKADPDDDDDEEDDDDEPRSIATVNAFLPVFRACADQVIRREVNAARRALKKTNGARDAIAFRTWLDEFYADQCAVARKAFEPVVTACLEVTDRASVSRASEIVEQLVTQEAQRSVAALQAVHAGAEDCEPAIEALLVSWELSRAADIAHVTHTLAAAACPARPAAA